MKKFALAGNPNCGKTTLFNALTGATAYVGNWPGVTVDKKEGVWKKSSEPVSIVDLPGIYSLSPYTPEEVISRNFILEEKPDCVINIVDATNLERNLYLTTQILEIDVPVVIALNMMDAVAKSGDKINTDELSQKIGVPVIEISALKNKGITQLMDVAIAEANKPRKGSSVITNGDLTHLIKDVQIALDSLAIENSLFHAIKLVELDELETKAHPEQLKMVNAFKETFNDATFGSDFEAMIASERYSYISKNFSPVVEKKTKTQKLSTSDKVDRVLTNKWAGIPIFLVILLAIFHLTFSENFLYLGGLISDSWVSFAGTPFEGLIGSGEGIASPGVILFNLMDIATSELFGWIGGLIEKIPGIANWALGLINDGIFAGLAGVLSFVPQIVFLLLLLSILEDTGYMARVAFILDRIFRRFGVSGRAFIPMIMGFGCSIPAMVNTRTLSDEREKTLTVRAIPFFTCGAKVPILAAVAGAIVMSFGIGNADLITYSMYVIGLAIAVITIILMRSTTQRGEVAPFIMELPSYHAPSFRNLMVHLWDKIKHYVKKVFTIILASTIVIWFLSNFSWDWKMVPEIEYTIGEEIVAVPDISKSILASLGSFIAPIFTPMGFGSQLSAFGWVFAVAAVTGLIAKENVIATFLTIATVVLSLGTVVDPELLPALQEIILGGEFGEEGYEVVAMIAATGIDWQALIAFIVFNMATIPCFAAVATAKGELSKKQFRGTIVFWLLTSYVAGTVTYVVLKWWWTAFIVAALVALVIVLIRFYNKKHPLIKEN